MNKLTAATIAASILAAPLVLAGPASAGTDKVTICHATSAANGHYNQIEVAKDAIAGGHAGHQDGRDIIPAYSWIDKGVRYYFEGQNLDQGALLANGCQVPAEQVPAAPNTPVYVPASCARPALPYGEVIIPKDLGTGVAGATSAMSTDPATFSVAYALAEPTPERVYSWPAGTTGTWQFTAVPITADPMYITDSKTGVGGCELANTGAKDLLLPALSGALVLGVGGAALIAARRRRTA